MLGSLKKLFFKDTGEDLATSIPEPAAIAPKIERVDTPSPVVATPTAGQPQATAAARAAQPAASELLSLPLASILARLPNSLASIVQSQGNGLVSLPISRILQELPKGSVKIPFGEVRLAAAPGTFFDNARHDQVLIELPLDEILSRLPAARLERRPDQRRIEISPEITDVFGPHGEGVSLSTAPVNVPKASGETSMTRRADTSFALRNETSAFRKSDTSATRKTETSATRRADTNMFMRNAPAVAPIPAAHSSPTAVVTQKTAISAASSAPSEPILVPLRLLSEGWAELVQVEIRQANLANNPVALPMVKLEEALRSGKAVFTWKQICAWMKPPVEIQSNAQDLPVELPLKVIAPLFIAKHRKLQPQKKLSVAEIPDLFSSKSEPAAQDSEPAKPAAPAMQQITPLAPETAASTLKPSPAPASMPPAAPAPAAPPVSPIVPSAPIVPSIALPKLEKKPDNITPIPTTPAIKPASSPASAEVGPVLKGGSIGEIFGQPTRTNWPPAEVLKQLLKLPGVTGAFLAMSDGLLVAAELPGTLKGETVAAFLPQIFGRMNQYAKEFQIGALTSLNFVAGDASWQIAKSGGIYLVALSKAGAKLPGEILHTIATELGKQIQ